MNFNVLGIETSCDDTSIGIVNNSYEVLLEKNHSQAKIHNNYGGVVPEIASRSHTECLQKFCYNIRDFLENSNINCISVTQGPGLIGSLLTGVSFAKSLSYSLDIPIIGVNHLEGHLMSIKLTQNEFHYPFIFLIISGGHSHIYIAHEFGDYELLGKTLDDAAGECFDKVGKALNLGYPAGCVIEKFAEKSKNREKFKFKAPMLNRKDTLNFSFSGLKTQIFNVIKEKRLESFTEDDISDICYATQDAIIKTLESKLILSIEKFKNIYPKLIKFDIFLCGGVSANLKMQSSLNIISNKYNCNFYSPPLKYSGDNGVMIALAGIERFKRGLFSEMNFQPYSRNNF